MGYVFQVEMTGHKVRGRDDGLQVMGYG